MPSDPENLLNYRISRLNVRNREALIVKNLSLRSRALKIQVFGCFSTSNPQFPCSNYGIEAPCSNLQGMRSLLESMKRRLCTAPELTAAMLKPDISKLA
jgi:hypothetical protein